VALAPILVTTGLISYDLLAVALSAASLLAWSRCWTILGGVLLGLAVSTRPATVAILIAVLALATRTGKARALVRYVMPAVIIWLGMRIVMLPGKTGDLVETFQAWRQSGPGYGSIWLVPQLIGQSEPPLFQHSSIPHGLWYKGGGLNPEWTTLLVMLGLIAVIVTTLVLGLSLDDRPRLAHLALFAVGGTLLLTKSLSPQASIVLLPLVALAGLRWRDHLIWATTEITYFVAVWLYIGPSSDSVKGLPSKGLPAGAYLVFLLARLFGIGWLLVAAVRAMRKPLIDPVRVPVDGSPGTDDPLGGALDGASDALVLRFG
jgi:uncharacterized membrane protein